MIMTDNPMPIVLLFIGIIFYVFGYVISNNGYILVIFDDLNNLEYEFFNENTSDNCEMSNENDCHGLLCLIHISPDPIIEFISISTGISGNDDLNSGFGVIQDENNIDNKILSGMCFCSVVSCFNNIFLTWQVVRVAAVVVIRMTVIGLFLDVFLIFAPRIDVLATFTGLLTTEFTALLSNLNSLLGHVIEYVDEFTVTHINGLFKLYGAANIDSVDTNELGDPCSGIISTIISGFAYGFNFGFQAVLSATNIEAAVIEIYKIIVVLKVIESKNKNKSLLSICESSNEQLSSSAITLECNKVSGIGVACEFSMAVTLLISHVSIMLQLLLSRSCTNNIAECQIVLNIVERQQSVICFSKNW